MSHIDSVFALVAREVAARLDEIDTESSRTKHWILIEDSVNVEFSSIVGDKPPHELLSSFIEQGVCAAAYVTYVPGRDEHVLAYVFTTNPPNSDVRRSAVLRQGRSDAKLAAWESTV